MVTDAYGPCMRCGKPTTSATSCKACRTRSCKDCGRGFIAQQDHTVRCRICARKLRKRMRGGG
jgi:hypothetical protein